jgi:hypothetical protein
MDQGLFSRSLLNLEIQLDDLITKAGGVDGVRLLDKLASMPESLRSSAIEHFLEILNGEWDEERENTPFESSQIKKGHLAIIEGGLNKSYKQKAG